MVPGKYLGRVIYQIIYFSKFFVFLFSFFKILCMSVNVYKMSTKMIPLDDEYYSRPLLFDGTVSKFTR